jgi:hypothetical protein
MVLLKQLRDSRRGGMKTDNQRLGSIDAVLVRTGQTFGMKIRLQEDVLAMLYEKKTIIL